MIKLFFLLVSLHLVLGARILAVFPFPAKSHHNIFHPVIKGLAQNGHQVTFVTPIKLDKPNANVKEIQIPNIMGTLLKTIDLTKLGKVGAIAKAFQFMGMSHMISEAFFATKEFQDIINSKEKYDVVLTESLFMQDAQSILAHKFDALGVDLIPHGATSWYTEMTGLVFNPSYISDPHTSFSPNMNFFERLENTLIALWFRAVGYYSQYKLEKMADKYFQYEGSETRPRLSKLASDKALILLNTHHSLGYPVPTAPHVKEVGGLNIKDVNPLPKDLQTFMDEAPHGVIYFSFGSNLNMTEIAKQGLGCFIDQTLWDIEAKSIVEMGQRRVSQSKRERQIFKMVPSTRHLSS